VIAVVTGSTGFIGRHTVAALLQQGWTVRAIRRPDSPYAPPPGAEIVPAPLLASSLNAAFRGARLVVHLAARVKAPSDAAFEIANVTATREVAHAAAQAGARLVHISSQAVAGPGTPDDPRSEEEAPRPITPYGRSKAAAEDVVRQTPDLDWTILRPVTVYGPRDIAFAPVFSLARLGIVPILQSPDASYTLVHVADVVRAILRAAESDRALGETCFIGHGTPVTLRRLINAMGDSIARRPALLRVPRTAGSLVASAAPLLWRIGREPALDRARLAELLAPGWVCQVDRARSVLGFTAAIDVDEGFRRSADWYARGASGA
jgi:nucleoside-diphosphate-sugar epimerase